MGGKARLAFLCIWIALLCDFTNGLNIIFPCGFLRRRYRCRKTRRFLCRKQKPHVRTEVPTQPTTQIPSKLFQRQTTETTNPGIVTVLNPVKPTNRSSLPYCKARDVNAVLKPSKSRTKRRAVAWPYKCQYASILPFSDEYQFIWPIYDCCNSCAFPKFTKCVSRKAKTPEWKCPSEGLHCVVGCITKHKPGGEKETAESIFPSRLKPENVGSDLRPDVSEKEPDKPILSGCERVKEENGRQCIEKLCVKLDFKP